MDLTNNLQSSCSIVENKINIVFIVFFYYYKFNQKKTNDNNPLDLFVNRQAAETGLNELIFLPNWGIPGAPGNANFSPEFTAES